jgi:hypothetical protein
MIDSLDLLSLLFIVVGGVGAVVYPDLGSWEMRRKVVK